MLANKAEKAHIGITPRGKGPQARPMMGTAPIIRDNEMSRKRIFEMAKRVIINEESGNNLLSSLSSLSFEGMDSKTINSLMEKLHQEAMQAKAALRKAEKEAKAAAKEAAKAAKSKEGGDIEKLAKILASIDKDSPLTKREIFLRYLEALGLTEEDENSVKKEATLSAQLGSRIAPKLEKLGRKLGSVREDGKIRYYTLPLSNEAEA